MRHFLILLTFVVLVETLSVPLFAADKPKRRPVDKPAAEMDYGTFLSVTVGAGKDNLTPKGIVIKLDKEKNANILFDTEMMRVSAAWTGSFLDLAGRVFADDSNDFSTVSGAIQFATTIRPGWSSNGKFDDPRDPKDGPIPAEWARYKGLYRHGDKVVLSYTVDDCKILELPGVKFEGDTALFSRTFLIGPSSRALALLVAESADNTAVVSSSSKEIVSIKDGDAVLTASTTAAPAGATWGSEAGRLVLKLPEIKAPVLFKITLARSAAPLGNFAALSAAAPENIEALTKGGPARWTETVTTKGVVSTVTDKPYVIDTLTAPEQNPYKSWLRFTGVDFFSDGRAALCTWSGDVWVVSGIDAGLENLVWKRYATGLNQPLGLKIVDDVVYTVGRDQITRFHDLNQDGEADFYENFNNDCMLTTNFHECCFDLQTDAEGNFYYTKGSSIWAGSLRMTAHSGTVIKVCRDGTKLEVLANGLRAPNGMAIGPNGEITCSDNQGNWVPECPINLIKKGAYYGWVGQGQTPKEREKPICWIPYNMDKSSAGQVWVYSDKWGPFKNHMLQNSYDCSLFHVMIEHVGDGVQGGTWKFPLSFPSGIMRARFRNQDGQLYVCGLRGWSSRAAKTCIFQRVRYTGLPVNAPYEVHTTKTGLDVTFTGALDAASVSADQNIAAEWFNVVRTAAYGSPEFNVSDPKKKGREMLEIKSAKLLPDGKTVSLEIPALKPVTNIVIKFKLKSADGSAVNEELDYTINQMP